MNNYFIGVLAAFLEPALHAWANIIDNNFSNKIFVRLAPLIFLSNLTCIFFIPVIFFLDAPTLISWQVAGIIFLIALIEVVYMFPYYYALRETDTSVVAALFSLGKIFAPLLAFLLIGEKLTLLQYSGFLLITISSILLVLDVRQMKINKAFILMLFVSVILAFESVLLKYLYNQGVSWGSSIVWMAIFQLFISSVLVVLPKNLKALKNSLTQLPSFWKMFLIMEILSWLGTLGSSLAIYLIPVSISKGISSVQPIFVLVYALIFAKYFPSFFKESLGKGGIFKKIILFIFSILGVWLIVA